jgi:hypothetical protein
MSAAELRVLSERVARLEEMEVARNHLHAYAETLDAPSPEAIAALFTDDGVLRVPAGDFAGREEITGFFRDRFDKDPSEKRHFLMNVRTQSLEPGLVEVASYFLFTARGERSVLGWGTYLDLIQVRDGVALFTQKTITPHVTTDLAAGWPMTPHP